MALSKTEKQKAKRKAKQKERRTKQSRLVQSEKADILFEEALFLTEQGNYAKALSFLRKALHLEPTNAQILGELVRLGWRMNSPEVQIEGLAALHAQGHLDRNLLRPLGELLFTQGRYQEALDVAQEALSQLSETRSLGKKKTGASLKRLVSDCENALRVSKLQSDLGRMPTEKEEPPPPPRMAPAPARPAAPAPASPPTQPSASLPPIPVTVELDTSSFAEALGRGRFSSQQTYELALEGHRIRFQETFDHLICLRGLSDVRSFWHQEETARKVLKSFRGRALLSDEVGLGKTIEALMVLKEYVQRGMVKTALILTPTPLVSQWQEELRSKFGMQLPSTDDPEYRSLGASFWDAPMLVASINLAKSRKNFSTVTEKEYDMVIVDEAHHLKNRNTVNWKLVNALKKRFLLLLTATPVENNLMELYNLITLLKPGQLYTASAFREEFMTRGDPTDPQNREKLRELLGQVMIRNTRAVARIAIPPRFAQTVRVEPSEHEKELYERVTDLVKQINRTDGTGHRLLLKSLLAEAGSSPQAVSATLSGLLQRRELPMEQEEQIRAIHNLCRSMDDTSKSRILETLIRATPGKKLVFVKYLATLQHLSDFLSWQGIPHGVFHGGMDNRKKDEAVQRFRDSEDLLVTTEIGGEGRNLQFCHQMINYDLPWNPMKIEQRIGRIHRIGQENEVLIHNLCAAGSVEDYILEVLDKKINMFEMVIGEIDMILGRVQGEQEFSDMVYDIWVGASSEEETRKSFDQLAARLKRSKTLYEKTKTLDEKLFGENYEL